MPITHRIYRRTAAGQLVWETQDLSVPADYRRLLALAENEVHGEAVRGALRQFPDELLEAWLTELEELGLLESVPAPPGRDFDFTAAQGPAPAWPKEDSQRFEQAAAAAHEQLSRAGAYVAEDRLRHRDPVERRPADTVVLIVEDDPDQLALADLRVTMAGYAVRVADSARALLEALRQHGAPDLLLLDVVLPDGNGFEILAKMRRHPTLALLPIVMLTAKDARADIERGLALGADGYITKPYTKDIVADMIRRVLKQQGED